MIASFVGLGFGLLWLFLGASAVGSPLGWMLGGVGVLLFVAVGIRTALRGWGTAPSGRPFDRRVYFASVAIEIAAIVLAQAWLAAHGRITLLPPVVGVIVGLHFLGLWRAWGRRSFLGLAGAMTAVNLAALLVPMPLSGRLALSGFGSAGALLAAVTA